MSNPIMEALEVAGYLVVICTPRLPQSQWCQREIETFIKLHGRNRVLAVLAEGEPMDSFPEILCHEEEIIKDEDGQEKVILKNLEPLAADVRGNSKKEIKKKIKQEVVRLATAMFQCGYDDLKQRHREQKLRKCFQISIAVSAVLLVFGCVSCYQAIHIDKQAKQIQKQYMENKKAQSDILATAAREKLDSGQRKESIKCALSALPDDLDEPEFPINYEAVCTLTEALRVYDTGRILKPETFLEQDADIDWVMALGNNMLATVDMYETLTIWNMEEQRVLTSYKTAGFPSDYQAKFYVIEDEMLLYLDQEGFHAVKLQEQESVWDVPIEDDGKILYNPELDKIIIVTNTQLYEIESTTGEIVKQEPFLEENLSSRIAAVQMSGDGSVYYVGVTSGEKTIDLYGIDSNSLKVKMKGSCQADDLKTLAVGTQDNSILLSTVQWKEEEGYFNTEYKVIAYDAQNFEQKWEYQSDQYAEEMYQLSNGQWIFQTLSSVVKLESSEGKVLELKDFDKLILNTYLFEDERLFLMLQDGSVLIQEIDAFSFINCDAKYKILDDWLKEFQYADGNFITLNFSEKKLLLYNMKYADGLEKTEYTKEELEETIENRVELAAAQAVCEATGQTVVCDLENQKLVFYDGENGEENGSYACEVKFIRQMCFSDTGEFLVVQYEDDAVEIIDTTEFSVKKRYEDMDSLMDYSSMNQEYFVLRDSGFGYVIAKDSFERIAKVDGYVSYDENNNLFLVCDSKEEVYQVPFYTVKELVEMAKEYK